MSFRFCSNYQPAGDQPQAIDALVKGILHGKKHQLLHGITGSGKTFTMASVIAATQRPALVLCHNKVLATQLHSELATLFPRNAVEFFTSDYDYYSPESYKWHSGQYKLKRASLDAELTRQRLRAITAALRRPDVIIVCSTSCLFDIGSPKEFAGQAVRLQVGLPVDAAAVIAQLRRIGYRLEHGASEPGMFAVTNDGIDVFPPYETQSFRVSLHDGPVDGLAGDELVIYPSQEHMLPAGRIEVATAAIEKELRATVRRLRSRGYTYEADRLSERVTKDVARLREKGYCPGIENYQPHLELRQPGDPPHTILEYLPDGTLVFIDESHVTIPQIKGAHRSDRSRKKKLIRAGYRLPSALDACPLTLAQWEARGSQVIYVSATPVRYELERSAGAVVAQILRPTGLLDPIIEVEHASRMMTVLRREINERARRGQRVLVMASTKVQAEKLAEMLSADGIRCTWLHGELTVKERTAALDSLRNGTFDVLVGVNLLREGLDLPKVSLVAVLDADKRGFLRSESSLLQMIGRAARNEFGKAILFGKSVTAEMTQAIITTERRREAQVAHNSAHGIIPTTTRSAADKEVQA